MVKLGTIKVKPNRINKNRRNLDHINCTVCCEKGQYAGNSECSVQTKLKEDTESFRKKKQGKYENKPPDGEVEQKYWRMLKMHNAVS